MSENDLSQSFGGIPKSFGYGGGSDYGIQDNGEGLANDDVDSEDQPRILLLGLKRSGKSSIRNVVFHKMSPNETLFLESTTNIHKEEVKNISFLHFEVWDIPGQLDTTGRAFDFEQIFAIWGAVIFVIDAQDDLDDALSRLKQTIRQAQQVESAIKFEVFIHKVDGLTDESKIDIQGIIQGHINEDFNMNENVLNINFHLTSIYDHSIFEAFSKVVQRLIRNHNTLESLLDLLQTHCQIEKSYLIDVVSKIYIATDSSQGDMHLYEICCDMIDVVIDISCIYGAKANGEGTFDRWSEATITLDNGTVLFLRQINKYLALVSIIRAEHYEGKKGILDYNVICFKNAVRSIFCNNESKTIPGNKVTFEIPEDGTPIDNSPYHPDNRAQIV